MVMKRSKKKLQNFLNYTKIQVILLHIYTVCCRDAYRNHDIFITIDRLVMVLLPSNSTYGHARLPIGLCTFKG